MYKFYVVVRHIETGAFLSFTYTTKNEILDEYDLANIEDVHAEQRFGMMEVMTQIISWQRFNENN